MDGERVAGAYGFSTRENKFYVFKAKATIAVMGGAVHVFRPRSVGEGLGRFLVSAVQQRFQRVLRTMMAGAEMTCQEIRFIPVRFKDAYGPVGAWFLLFKSRATSATGGEYMVRAQSPSCNNWAPYGLVKPIPANLRNYLGMLDTDAGLGPLYMETAEAIQKLADAYRARPQGLQEEDEGSLEIRGLGRLPGHDRAPRLSAVGRQQYLPREKAALRSPRASLTSSAPTPALPVPGFPVPKTWTLRTSGATAT